MNRRAGVLQWASVAAVLPIALVGVGQAAVASAGAPTRVTRAAEETASSVTARLVAGNLSFPAAFTFAPDGKIFYGERWTGRIRILNPVTGSKSVFFTVPNLPPHGPLAPMHVAGGEQGLLGIALHPDYPVVPYVYVFVTREFPGDVHKNQLLRLTNSGGTGTNMAILLSIDAQLHHNGGRILFGPDRMLYIQVGDKATPAYAQDLSNNHGKMLRITAGGAAPADNPFPGSLIYSYGLRNGFGFTFDPVTGYLWETENGSECNDEINRIIRGRNYGWGPNRTCNTPPSPPVNTNRDGPSPVLPLRYYNPTIAPTGAVFCAACGLPPELDGRLFFGSYDSPSIRALTLNSTRTNVASQSIVLRHNDIILSMERAPDNTIYFSDTSGLYKLIRP